MPSLCPLVYAFIFDFTLHKNRKVLFSSLLHIFSFRSDDEDENTPSLGGFATGTGGFGGGFDGKGFGAGPSDSTRITAPTRTTGELNGWSKQV